MSKTKKYRSEALQAVHETVAGFHRIGLVDKATMREFDLRCLTPVQEFSPDDIRKLRNKYHLSQAVLENCLNVRPGVVSKWERGEKKPGGPSLKLLSLIKEKGLEAVL